MSPLSSPAAFIMPVLFAWDELLQGARLQLVPLLCLIHWSSYLLVISAPLSLSWEGILQPRENSPPSSSLLRGGDVYLVSFVLLWLPMSSSCVLGWSHLSF